MRYLSLYRPADVKQAESGTPPTPEEMARMGEFMGEFIKTGKLLAAEGCLPTSAGMKVRQAGGKVTVTDGPFTEAKEVIAGLAVLAADSREEAIEQARLFLAVAGDGECEIRLLHEQPACCPADGACGP